jgi:hypothetical protein
MQASEAGVWQKYPGKGGPVQMGFVAVPLRRGDTACRVLKKTVLAHATMSTSEMCGELYRDAVLECKVRSWVESDAFPGRNVALYELRYRACAKFRAEIPNVIFNAHVVRPGKRPLRTGGLQEPPALANPSTE